MLLNQINDLNIGSKIIITDGLFTNFKGIVKSVDFKKKKCIVSLDLWDIGYTFESSFRSIEIYNEQCKTKIVEKQILKDKERYLENKRKKDSIIPGSKVAILMGPLKGLEGKVIKKDIENMGCKISLDLMGEGFNIDISLDGVEKINNYLDEINEIGKNVEIKINSSLIERINNTSDLLKITPYQFEELIGEILEKQGFDVKITPKSKDGGRDILSILKTPIGEILTIVECKQYSVNKKVGIEIAERLLWTCDNKDYASKAMIVTTSAFTKGCYELKEKYLYKLELKDMNNIIEWLCKYGITRKYENKTIWSPSRNIII
jgi:transcription antitermination factor NusG